MYRYDDFDRAFVHTRAEEFRDQVGRRLSGELTEDEFRPLRLMNGLYLQLHAYMLRVAIPYGTLDPAKMRQLAMIAERWDKGYGHFTTRQNIQFNWIKLVEAPDAILALAEADMHAIQTSGNCIRNVTADPFAGAAHDEIEDPRPWAEILRQWSTIHPEFTFLPRKFKIGITGALTDRAAVLFHDIGLKLVKGPGGEVGFRVFVGGGQGRTPMVGKEIRAFLAKSDLLTYTEAILRAYNRFGRRDNLFKARIKILVHEIGIDAFREEVEKEWAALKETAFDLAPAEKDRILEAFAPRVLPARPHDRAAISAKRASDPAFRRWMTANVAGHRDPDYAIVTITLKGPDRLPGDATAEEMERVAGLAERFGNDEVRVAYTQNLVLPHVARADLLALYEELRAMGVADTLAEHGADIISCPGLDYCNLANARSLPIAEALSRRLGAPERQAEIGPLRINMSGCINACGHHHAGHIGILGVDKKGEEAYQVTLGGSPGDDAAVGEIVGKAFSAEDVPGAIDTILDTYLAHREPGETFLAAWKRLGNAPFKEALYGVA